MQNRYGTQAAEAEFEPESRTTVLAKWLGIPPTREMARRESEGLAGSDELGEGTDLDAAPEVAEA